MHVICYDRYLNKRFQNYFTLKFQTEYMDVRVMLYSNAVQCNQPFMTHFEHPHIMNMG